MNVTTCFNLCHYSFNITDANTNPSAIDGTYDDQWDASDFITATSNLAPAEAMELGAKNQVCLNSDLSREPKGIYLLLVNDGQQVTTKKLIKQ